MGRIRDMEQAEAMRRRLRDELEAVIVPGVRAGPMAAHGVTGVGKDGFSVDFDELGDADRELGRLQDDLFACLRSAVELAAPIEDGRGPVAARMRAAYVDRADAEGGVQAVLEDYIEELVSVRVIIRETLRAYQQVDEHAARVLASLAEDAR